jgi:hypothetical protein
VCEDAQPSGLGDRAATMSQLSAKWRKLLPKVENSRRDSTCDFPLNHDKLILEDNALNGEIVTRISPLEIAAGSGS